MSLYQGTAELYAQYRDHYSQIFFEELFAQCGINKSSVVMDLACGPGTVALDIAPLVRKVIAIDIEEAFLEKGKALAAEKGITNIEWHLLDADDISTLGQMVNMIIISHAFHWLNREKVAEMAYRIITPGGSLVIAKDNTTPKWNTPELKDLVKELVGEKGNSVRDLYREKNIIKHEDILKEAGFKLKELTIEEGLRQTSPERALGWFLSTSYANPGILGDKIGEFKESVGHKLKQMPASAFVEEASAQAIIGKK